jgi:hypothetical protein
MIYHIHFSGKDEDVVNIRRKLASYNSFMNFDKIIDKDSQITPEQRKWFEQEKLSDLYADAYNHVNFDEEKTSSRIAWGTDGNVADAYETGLNDVYIVFAGKKCEDKIFDALKKLGNSMNVSVETKDISPEYSMYSSYSEYMDVSTLKKSLDGQNMNEDIFKASYFNHEHIGAKGYTPLREDEALQFGIQSDTACLFKDGFVCSSYSKKSDTLKALQDANERFTTDTTLGLPIIEEELKRAKKGDAFLVTLSIEENTPEVAIAHIHDTGINHKGIVLADEITRQREETNRKGSFRIYHMEKGSDVIRSSYTFSSSMRSEILHQVRSEFLQLEEGTMIRGTLRSRTNGYNTKTKYYNETEGEGIAYIVMSPGIHGQSMELYTDDGLNYKTYTVRKNNEAAWNLAETTDYDFKIDNTRIDMNKFYQGAEYSKEELDSLQTLPLSKGDELFKKRCKMNGKTAAREVNLTYKKEPKKKTNEKKR